MAEDIVENTPENQEVTSPEAKPEIPIPGTKPIPEGHIRLFHFTYPRRVDNIRNQGLINPGKNEQGRASDIGLNYAPNSIWVYSDLNLENPPGWTIGLPYLEFSESPDNMGPHNSTSEEGTARTLKPEVEILPEKILAIHEPWHEMVRHAKDGVIDPEWLESYISQSVRIAGERNTRGNYTDYSQMAEQKEYLEDQLSKAQTYLTS